MTPPADRERLRHVAPGQTQAVPLMFDGELTSTSQWFIESDAGLTSLDDLQRSAVRAHPLPTDGKTWTERSASTGVQIEYTLDTGPVTDLRARVTNGGDAAVTLRWRQTLRGLPTQGTLFAPSGKDFYDLGGDDVALGYRATGGDSLSIPLVTVFDRASDVGYTIAAHIEMPLPPLLFRCHMADNTATVDRQVLSLPPGQSCTVRQFIVRHAGDWRPGLAFVRERYPSFFMLPSADLLTMHGCFTYSNVADAALCRRFAREGVKNVEIHWNFPHLGKYVPEEEPWITAMDDKWSAVKRTTDPAAPPEDAPYETIKAYLAQVVKPVGTVQRVRQFIRELHDSGIRAFVYFQPTESWEFFANTHFPGSIARHPDGGPVLTWFDHVVMNCRPETRWGQYLCGELERLLQLYPEVDGVFMDQSAEDGNDYAVCAITDKLARIVEKHGKTCYWNGPYLVELIEHAAGMLAEGGSLQAEKIKFLTIGNIPCCGMGRSERQYQRNLVNGLWPAAPSQSNEQQFRYADEPATVKPIAQELAQLHERYMPLFELYVGKMWVLEPDPIALPEDVQGNLFSRPDGDYLAPLIVPSRTMGDGSMDAQVQVTVRVSGAKRMKHAYLRTPDAPGQFEVDMMHEGDTIRVTLPWLGSAALLWLSSQAQAATPMPPPPEVSLPTPRQVLDGVAKLVMAASIRMDGVVPTGSRHGVKGGLNTTAPLPPIPTRKAYINGHEIGEVASRNYRGWHTLLRIGVRPEIVDYLRERDNELVIEPAGPDDFFMVRNLRLTIMLADGRVVCSEAMAGPWSSCADPRAQGVIGSPIRIRFAMEGTLPWRTT